MPTNDDTNYLRELGAAGLDARMLSKSAGLGLELLTKKIEEELDNNPEARKKLESFAEQGEVLTSEKIARNIMSQRRRGDNEGESGVTPNPDSGPTPSGSEGKLVLK